jgi:hypothetical protein
VKMLKITNAPALRVVSPDGTEPKTAGEALAEALGLAEWLAGPGPWVTAEAAEVDRAAAADFCELCLAEATLAVAVHHVASRRYRVFSVCPHCLRMGEV